MKILITGAGGMLGSDLAVRLSSQHQLAGIGRRSAPHLRIPYKMGNLANPKIASDFIQAERPEIILHAAAMTDVDGCETDRRQALLCNFEATRNVTESGNQLGALILFFSTDFVFDGTKPSPYQEEDTPHPINVYGETKLLAEQFLLSRGKRFLILRTAWLFGRHGNNFPKKILKQIETGKPFPVISDQFGNPTFTGDLAAGVEKLIEALPRTEKRYENQIYHIANEGAVSRYEFARSILRKKNYSLDQISPIGGGAFPRPARRPQNSALSCEKLKMRFGIQLPHWEQGLDSYLQEEVSAQPSASP